MVCSAVVASLVMEANRWVKRIRACVRAMADTSLGQHIDANHRVT